MVCFDLSYTHPVTLDSMTVCLSLFDCVPDCFFSQFTHSLLESKTVPHTLQNILVFNSFFVLILPGKVEIIVFIQN